MGFPSFCPSPTQPFVAEKLAGRNAQQASLGAGIVRVFEEVEIAKTAAKMARKRIGRMIIPLIFDE